MAATERAIAEGVPGVPTVTVAGRHLGGDDRLEDAARALAGQLGAVTAPG